MNDTSRKWITAKLNKLERFGYNYLHPIVWGTVILLLLWILF